MFITLFIESISQAQTTTSGCIGGTGCGFAGLGPPIKVDQYPNNIVGVRDFSLEKRLATGCYCDTLCQLYGDCCFNYVQVCQSIIFV